MLSMKDKVAIVTGAGSIGPGWGNGKATATLLARQGASVFLVDINEAAVQETRQIIEGEGGTCAVHRCDMTVAAEVQEMVQACLEPLQAHRHPGEQCRWLGARRSGVDDRGGVGPADRYQPEDRVPRLQIRAAGDGGSGQGRHRQPVVGRRTAQ